MAERLSYESPKAPASPRQQRRLRRRRFVCSAGGGAARAKATPLTLEEAIAKTSAVVRLAYAEAVAKHTTATNRKATTITMAVALDKWLALTGRPTQIMGYANVEEMRPAVRALALRLLALKTGSTGSGEPPTP